MQAAFAASSKDKRMSAVYRRAIEMLSEALELWPTANVKFHSVENLLKLSKNHPTRLAQGLDVMNKVIEKQPHLFIGNNIQHITQVCSQTNPTLHFYD